MKRARLYILAAAITVLAACGEDSSGGAASGGGTPEPQAAWGPSIVYPTARRANSRGYLDRRGLIHAHSYYSHDACDNEPVKNGQRDPICFDDFRRGLCQSQHDFVMLSDHSASFSEYEFPDVLLYRPDRGDRLVNRNTKPVASWASCPDGSSALVMAGAESGFMPVGLEEHVAASVDERNAIYTSKTLNALEAQRSKGAAILIAHPEDWTADQLGTLPIDGFEMYNLHANLLRNPGPALELLLRVDQGDPQLPHSDLILLSLITEDPRYLSRWGSVLASGVKRTTTMGTDCHRNTFTAILPDGERGDSYRRLMLWFSNHLLIRPEVNGTWDDRHVKEALKNGRLYGAFEVMGYPDGFDYHAQAGNSVFEMGGEINLAQHPVLQATAPKVHNLNPERTPPQIKTRLLRAIPGGFESVAEGESGVSFTPSITGAYRVEVRMVPRHLREDLGRDADKLLAKDYVWIYSNPIYVR